MKIPEVRYIKFKSTRNFGIELEVNERINANELVRCVSSADPDRPVIQSAHYQQDYDNDYWHVKFDRSCGDVKDRGGWEVASYKASGYKDIEKMSKIAEAMKAAGAVTNNECGFHIHAEIADFKHDQAAALVAYWMKIEPVVLEILPKHRKNNKYAKPLTKKFEGSVDKLYNAKQFWEIVRPQRFDNPNRRVALNMCNYAQWVPNRKTVELRLPEGTLDGKEVKNWIRFFLCFVDFVRKKEFPGTVEPANLYETMKIIGLHNENPFFILSKAMRDTKMWLMRRILLYSTKKKLREEAETFLNALEVTPSIRPARADIEPEPEEKPKKIKKMVASPMVWWKPGGSGTTFGKYESDESVGGW